MNFVEGVNIIKKKVLKDSKVIFFLYYGLEYGVFIIFNEIVCLSFKGFFGKGFVFFFICSI